METLTIGIDSLAYGGNGVGRNEGIVYFVPFSVPGDLLEIRTVKKEKRYREGEIIRIIKPSPDRVAPPCPYFGQCGGCQWQQVDYKKQLDQKISELRSLLLKNRMPETAEKINPVIASPKQFGYRRTARFKIGQTTQGSGAPDYGFYSQESHNLIRIDNCMLLDDRINHYMPQVKTDAPGLVGFDLFMDEAGTVKTFYRFSEKDPGADFFQVNSDVNGAMLEYLDKKVRPRLRQNSSGEKGARILDIYCGDGNLSLPFADIAASITGWDSSGTAIERGKLRAEKVSKTLPGCKIRYFRADITRSWKNIAGYAKQTDCIILDPPRKGLKNQVPRISGLNIPLIVYISCSPPALVRDLAVFRENGYEVEDLQPFDMFPQTYHLETVAVLSRK